LNWSLRQFLGDGVQQKGSLVDAEKLRFDFSHHQALSTAELNTVQLAAFQAMDDKPLQVYTSEVPQDQALKINGLRAVFGEKYPPVVRVVSIGVPVEELLANPSNLRWREYSVEFCGGTHLSRTSDAAMVVIIAEEAVSKGIRRIVALTGQAAHEASANARVLDLLVEKNKALPDAELVPAVAEMLRQLSSQVMPLGTKRQLQLAVAELQTRAKSFEKANKFKPGGTNDDAIAVANSLLATAPRLGPGKMIVGEIAGASDDQLRSAIDSLKKKTPSYGILLAAANGDKVTFIAVVSDDLIAAGLKAGDWVKEAAKVAGGGGGGRPQMAQAGGKDPSKLQDALAKGREFAVSVVKAQS